MLITEHTPTCKLPVVCAAVGIRMPRCAAECCTAVMIARIAAWPSQLLAGCLAGGPGGLGIRSSNVRAMCLVKSAVTRRIVHATAWFGCLCQTNSVAT